MTCRPILFSAAMVSAILQGRKTQTRRIMKVQPADVEYYLHGKVSDRHHGLPCMREANGQGWAMCGPFKCPFIADGMYAGQSGRLGNSRTDDTTERHSRLWVRETWRTGSALDHCKPSDLANGAPIQYEADKRTNINNHEEGAPYFGWGRIRQSIYMRRWMSRITLEVTAVRVERLQDISAEDAIAEGIPIGKGSGPIEGETTYHMTTNSGYMRGKAGAIAAYEDLWQSIHGPGSWAANPYVWVIEFKRI